MSLDLAEDIGGKREARAVRREHRPLDTGLGIWTEDMFLRAIRTGRHMGVSRPIQPPMPWKVYGQMTDDDLKAIYAFLRTIPPIHNQVPEYLEPHEVATMN